MLGRIVLCCVVLLCAACRASERCEMQSDLMAEENLDLCGELLEMSEGCHLRISWEGLIEPSIVHKHLKKKKKKTSYSYSTRLVAKEKRKRKKDKNVHVVVFLSLLAPTDALPGTCAFHSTNDFQILKLLKSLCKLRGRKKEA